MKSLRITTKITPCLLALKFVYTFLLFPKMQVFSADTSQMNEFTRTLEETFGYNFNYIPDLGDVFIWKISGNHEKFTSLQYNGKDVQFGSNETFLILTRKSLSLSTAYYWIGVNTSMVDKQVAAKNAILLSHYLQNTKHKYFFTRMNIAREIEGMESDSFHHTMKMFSRHAVPHTYENSFGKYIDYHFPAPRPNLYVIWGIEHSRIKKIPFSLGLRWLLQQDICMIPEFEYEEMDDVPVNFLCNTEASEKQIERSRRIATWLFWDHYSSLINSNHRIENCKQSNEFKEFLQVLEDISFYNPDEIDDSDDHLKNVAEFVRNRDLEILLYDVTNDGLKVNSRRPMRSSMFQSESMGYLLDTKSVAGVFLVLAYSEYINTRVKAIQLAEEYLDKRYASSSEHIVKMRIIENDQYSYIVDFKINLSDHPFIDRQLPEDELW